MQKKLSMAGKKTLITMIFKKIQHPAKTFLAAHDDRSLHDGIPLKLMRAFFMPGSRHPCMVLIPLHIEARTQIPFCHACLHAIGPPISF